MTESVETIGIVGTGRMGTGIAYETLLNGFHVLLSDTSDHQLDAAVVQLRSRADRDYQAGKLTRLEYDILLAHIESVWSDQEFARCKLVIETVVEDEIIKRDVYRRLCSELHPDAILATNASSLPITRLAAETDRPERFIGMHFMYPVHSMELVELVRGIATSDSTFEYAKQFVARLGKTAAVVEDFPGFIVDRVLLCMINEAIYALHEGVASISAIDAAMRFGAHQPMGPLELADFLGLDHCLLLMQALHRGLSDTKYRPCPLLTKYVEAGWIGRKVGRGFYDYGGETPVPTR
jgi:3-hydroxybutyryl-CoA dehydrogenase